MDDIMKIVKSRRITGSLIRGVSETIQNEAKKTKSWISWCMLLGTVGAGLWGNSLGSKREKAIISEKGAMRLVKEPLEQVKQRLELVRTFNVA